MTTAEHTYVDDERGLATLLQGLEAVDRVAVDIEADSLHHYFAKVCLIQLSFANQDYIVDPLCGLDLTPLLGMLKDKHLVFHAGDYDLRMLRSSYGFVPGREVFDTMLAAQLLGEEQLGLVTIMDAYLGVRLSKSGQKSDWSRRPLSTKQVEYAVDDTRYLLQLASTLEQRLESLGRRDWQREMCQRMVESTQQDSEPTPEDRLWRVKGTRDLSQRQLAFVRSLWYWREREGQESDRPVFKVMGNERLVELACWAEEHLEADLEQGPSLPRTCTGRRRKRLVAALREAEKMPRSEWPPLRPRRLASPQAEVDRDILAALRDECARIAQDLGIAPSTLAPKAVLMAVARDEATTQREMRESSPMLSWQAELLHEAVKKVLEGKHE